MMSEDQDKKARAYTQGNEDARDGFPPNRFLSSNADYMEGYNEFKSFMSAYVSTHEDRKRKAGRYRQ